ncbi:MAG: septal ring lytic transglycosylase RlpA family protein [Gammaproteobacteria bacterium]|jgi:rare lipoprotein A
MNRPDLRTVTVLATSLIFAACGGMGGRSDGPPPPNRSGDVRIATEIPAPEPKSRYGNPPFYEVFGKRYHVLPTAEGYRERGVASWYGTKFHGQRTSSGETYDMHAFTAAHKTLPLPTWVEVTNLRNRKSILVRVNDRGPFVANRIIDLSYAAASELDIVQDGTGLVEVRAMTFGAPSPGDTMTVSAPAAPPADNLPAPAPLSSELAATGQTGDAPIIYVQVGAFGERDNAERMHARLLDEDIASAFIHEDAMDTRRLFRVRVGPIPSVEAYDAMVGRLAGLGIDRVHLIIE